MFLLNLEGEEGRENIFVLQWWENLMGKITLKWILKTE